MNKQMSSLLKPVVAMVTMTLATFAAQAQAPAGDVKAGESKAAMCIGCHGIPGYQNSFPEIHKVPMIQGQSDKYIVSALTAYKKGDRKHPTMRGIAGSLSEQDMADLAAYYASHADKTAPDTPRTASTTAAADARPAIVWLVVPAPTAPNASRSAEPGHGAPPGGRRSTAVAAHRSGAVAQMLQMPVATLRVWERRYGFPKPLRDRHDERQQGQPTVHFWGPIALCAA